VTVLEQRKSRRFDLKLPIEFLHSGHETLLEGGETKNVSSCGVLFRSTGRVEPGDIVEYAITLPTTSADIEVRLRCKGKVVRLVAGLEVAATLERYEFVRQAKPRTV
jgi:PilZ domain